MSHANEIMLRRHRLIGRRWSLAGARGPNLFAVTLLSLAWGTIAGAAPECVPVEGTPFEASLVAVDAKWQLQFDVAGQSKSLPASDVVVWGALAEPAAGPRLILADGGVLVADVKDADRERITVDSRLFGELQIPLEQLVGIVFQSPSGSRRVEQIASSVRSAEGNADRLYLDNGDELSGKLRTLQMRGTGGGTLQWESEVGDIDIAADRIVAIAFNPRLVARPHATGMQAMVGFRDGSCLRADSLALTSADGDHGTAWISLPGNLTWQTAAKEIVLLQPLGERVRYLSDLTPVGYRQLSFLDTADIQWELGRDVCVSGRQLRTGGQRYLKGLGMHSAARVTYEIEPGDRRFEAAIALDDEAGLRGSVVFRVYVDSEQKYASPVVRGGEPPIGIAVDVRGGQKLNLIVDFADRGDQLDRAVWLNARLVR